MLVTPDLSIIIPAHNEQENLSKCLGDLLTLLVDQQRIDLEIIVVNDNSTDNTEKIVQEIQRSRPLVRLVRREPPGGFGLAIRAGLPFVRGQYVIIYMADCSDHPDDALRYYRKLQEGYDCVFGSRFVPGAVVHNYPRLKLLVNRIVNKAIQWMFWTKLNDLTNAFKGYRTETLRRCGPYRSCHFNMTLELSLSALISGYRIAEIPIHWEGRTWGSSKLRMREMGRRYLCILMMLFFQRILISDDVQSERTRRETSLGEEVTLPE